MIRNIRPIKKLHGEFASDLFITRTMYGEEFNASTLDKILMALLPVNQTLDAVFTPVGHFGNQLIMEDGDEF